MRALPTAAFLLAACAACRPAAPPGTVVYASGADLQSINPLVTVHPLAKQVQRYALFLTLVRYDSALVPRPYLASAWSWSADRRTLTFTLRGDVRWHDGRATSSADAAFTLEAARDPATAYPRRAELACVERIAAPDPRTLALHFCRPQDALLDLLTDLAVLPAHLLSDVPRPSMATAPFNEQPVGNGPYRFVAHEAGRRWVFEANTDFPAALGGTPAVRRLVVAVVDEATTKLAALVAGELDFAGIAPMHAAVVARVRDRAVLDYPLLFTYGLVWNTARPPFHDPRLRRALSLAIHRQRLVAAAVYGFGEVAAGPVPSAHPLAAEVETPPFDPAAARALLDSLGFGPSGRRLAFTVLTVGAGDAALEQLIQADLAAVGVDMRIRQLQLGAYLETSQSPARDYDALVLGVPGDLALGYLRSLFDSRRRDEPLQVAQYANPDVDRALDRGDLAEVQRIVARELPITFLYHGRGVQGVHLRVRNVRMDLRGELASLTGWHLAR